MSAAIHFDLPHTETTQAVSVALSGGIDSVVLLHLCFTKKNQRKIKNLRAIHINHNLNPASEQWMIFCEQLCNCWNIPLHVETVQLPDVRRKGTERIAREARYRIFTKYLQEGEYLFQGHHQNDQAETVLFRLLRGSDPYGLSAIPQQRKLGNGFVFRPLFTSSRAMIQQYAQQHNLSWVEDDSNSDTGYTRNFLRQRVLPLLQKRWSSAVKSLAESAAQCASSQIILDEVAKQDLQNVEQTIDLPLLGRYRALCCEKLKRLSFAHQMNLLKFWFRSVHLPVPNKDCLERVISEMLTAGADRHPYVQCYGIQIRRYYKWLILDPVVHKKASVPVTIVLNKGLVTLPENNTTLEIAEASATSPATIKRSINELQVTYRPYIHSLEPFAIHKSAHKKPLKKWLNELQVPEWIRDHIPLLMHYNELVMVPGLFTNVQFASTCCEQGWEITWQPTVKHI
ncbi:MAG: tRNA lysidine(34) synthetase TilS [Endozoicomonadaceae bacterium]|nr:tRNA lysidine(34) synthetase TilS [Endozoicomonadaceae bacterium]